MKVLSVVGITQSGKTTTVCEIITELKKRGYSVGSVKEIHFEQFAIDTPGSNTARHRKAGAELVSALGLYETDILFDRKLPIHELLQYYDYDYVVLEGVADGNFPMILTGHNTDELDERWNEYVFAVSGRISAQIDKEYNGVPAIDATTNIKDLVDLIEDKVYDMLPNFDADCCSACGYSCETLGAEVLSGKAERSSCIIDKADITLTVDGENIQMVPFVQNILRNTVLGVVTELKGGDKGGEIIVKIKGNNE